MDVRKVTARWVAAEYDGTNAAELAAMLNTELLITDPANQYTASEVDGTLTLTEPQNVFGGPVVVEAGGMVVCQTNSSARGVPIDLYNALYTDLGPA